MPYVNRQYKKQVTKLCEPRSRWKRNLRLRRTARDRSGVGYFLVILLALAAIHPIISHAQTNSGIVGNYSAMLGPLHLKLHLKRDSNGSLTGLLDSPDQGASGIPCADIKVDGQSLSFAVPSVDGKWAGIISNDYKKLSGNWTQGKSTALDFKRDTPRPIVEKSTDIEGAWVGALDAGGQLLHIQVRFDPNSSGQIACRVDSLEQHAFGLECSQLRYTAPVLSFDVPKVKGHWEGKLSDDGNVLNGTWNQGASFPLRFTRQTP